MTAESTPSGEPRSAWKTSTFRQTTGETALIAFTGDTLLGYPNGNPVRFGRDLLRHLGQCDAVIVNQEGPFTNGPPQKETGAILCAPPSCGKQLRELHTTAANLANNHIMDHGVTGLKDTISVLDKSNIPCFGAGLNSAQAGKPFVIELPFARLALLAFAHEEGPMASPDGAGPMPFDPEAARAIIDELRRSGHLVCAQYHGGRSYYRLPVPRRRWLFRELAGAGAHMVIGHHGHAFQAVEYFRESFLAYGLGNFYLNVEANLHVVGGEVGLLVAVEVDRHGPVGVRYLFVVIDRDGEGLSILDGEEARTASRVLDEVSEVVQDDREYLRGRRYECLHRMRTTISTRPTRYPGTLGKALRVGGSFCGYFLESFRSPIARDVFLSGLAALPQLLCGPRRRTNWYPRLVDK